MINLFDLLSELIVENELHQKSERVNSIDRLHYFQNGNNNELRTNI